MPVKEKLSGISLEALIPAKTKLTRKIIIKDDSFRSSQFVIPQNRKSTSSFTGRTKELDYLRVQYSKTLQQIKNKISDKEKAFKPIITGIKGEPGIGKSRLMQEFLNRTVKLSAGKINNVVSGKNLKTAQNSLGPFAEIVPEFNQQKFLPGENGNYREAAVYIKEKLFKKAEYLNSQGLPLVLAIEDMQWADENTLYILDHLLRAINLYGDGEQPLIFLILNYRNSFKPTKVMRQESEYHELMLDALDEKNTLNLINNLTGSTKLNTKIRELIAVRADGNPFNIEEWCSLVTANKKLNRVPQTVRHLLVEKISGLTPGERSILIAACISGRKFDIRFVNEVLKRAGKAEAESDDIKNLEEKRYIINLTGSTYEFRHDILHETLYMQLEAGLRRELHKIAGKVTEELYKSKLSDHYYELARHFSLAKDETKTIEYLEKAGDKAKGNYEHERALRFYRKLLPKLAENQKFEVIFKMCDVHMNRSEWNKQIEHCNAILKTSRLLDKRIKAECYKRIGDCWRYKGEYNKAMIQYRISYKLNEILKDTYGKLSLLELQVKTSMESGNYNEAFRNLDFIYKTSIKENFSELLLRAMHSYGIIYSKLGKYDDAIKMNLKLYQKANELSNKSIALSSKINLAQAYYFLGKIDRAKEIYENCLIIATKYKSYRDILICKSNIGTIYYHQHKFKNSIKVLQQLIINYKLLGDSAGLSRVFGIISACYISLGNYQKAEKYLKKQLEISKKLKRKQTTLLCTSNLGAIYNLTGQFIKAIQIFNKQLLFERKSKNLEGIYRAILNKSMAMYYLRKLYLAKKYAMKAMQIAKENNIGNNYVLAVWHLARLMYEFKNYYSAYLYAKEAMEYAIENKNNYLIVFLKILLLKIKVFHFNLNIEVITTDYIEEKLINPLLKLLESQTNIEEKALINYELWKITNSNSVKIINAISSEQFRKKSIFLYTKLYKNTPQYEFQLKIKELRK